MLSPGTYHERVPRDPTANLRFRLRLLRAATSDAHRLALKHACKQDCLFYINSFAWQYNPLKFGSEVGPFVTYAFQDEAVLEILDCIESGKDLVIEKSREMGASWLCLLVIDWLWRFMPNKKILVISRNEKAVDDEKNADSLFWKLDHLHRHLPSWMAPRGWTPKHRQKNNFRNPETGSAITGEASTGKAGVGGRATVMFIDEFSQIAEDYEVLHRTSNTTKCRIFNGTHLGLDTAFYELTRRVDIRKLRMHWSMHPDKVAGLYKYDPVKKGKEVLDTKYHFPADYKFIEDGSPTGGYAPGLRSVWYDEDAARKGDARAVAMDLDIDPAGTVSQFFDPLVVRHLQAAYCRPPVWKGDLSFTDDGVPLEFTKGDAGKLWLWDHLEIGGMPRPGRYAAGADTSEGKGATPSVLTIVDAITGRKVLEFASAFTDPRVFGRMSAALCRAYHAEDGSPAKLAWEMQGPGLDFSEGVIQAGFTNFYFRTNEFDLQKKQSLTPGWYPSPTAKRKLMGDYRDALRTRQFENPSERALEETLAFEETREGVDCDTFPADGDPSGATLCHGDRVVADALAWMMKLKICAPVRPGRQPALGAALSDHRSAAGRRELAARSRLAAEQC